MGKYVKPSSQMWMCLHKLERIMHLFNFACLLHETAGEDANLSIGDIQLFPLTISVARIQISLLANVFVFLSEIKTDGLKVFQVENVTV